jgi:ketosteroid isomerase-like protein
VWVRGVDPRDTRWEVPHPIYRVYFWELQRPHDPRSRWVSHEWEIGDADIDEVLNWARDNAAGRRFVIYVRVVSGQPGEPGLVRLLGTDPLD